MTSRSVHRLEYCAVDDIMGSIVFFVSDTPFHLPPSDRFTPLCLVMLLILSLMWANCSYCLLSGGSCLCTASPVSSLCCTRWHALLSSASVALLFHRPVMADRLLVNYCSLTSI
ncbi:hypothetical protein KCP75_05800 [Salmonella enterica subsp. enterica]|nr:hypothetical protein KCP75_05800 [Salmonella enterica subsp. enterica]